MTKIEGAVILLTGASGGFGQELTRQLLVLGGRLILSDYQSEPLTEFVQTLTSTEPGEVIATLTADLSSPKGCNDLYQQVQALGLPVDILINNAGLGLFGRLDEVPSAEWERLMEVNLLAPMRLSSLYAPDAIAHGFGHIVNISSLAGWVALPGLSAYSASKFGMRGLSESLAAELAPHGVKVTGVYPFFSRTSILDSPAYGSLVQDKKLDAKKYATDPADVMRKTIQGIRRDRKSIFPDRPARLLQLIKTFLPGLINLFNR
ncbi:MAG: SDR family NAD(P)-dependent oxidoreductase [Cyanobacteria bacterium P01_H01_bin.15]